MIDKKSIEKLSKQPYAGYQIALQVFPQFRKEPTKVANELKEILSKELLVDVVNNLCLNCMADILRSPAKFLEDHHKKVLDNQQQMEKLFPEELKALTDKEFKANLTNENKETKEEKPENTEQSTDQAAETVVQQEQKTEQIES